ncbi:MAG: PLP-dependent transferase, partial [Pseudomonadota bacterium]
MTKSRPFNGHKPSVRQQSTCAANAGVAADKEHRAVAPPLHLAANYAWDDPCEKPAFDYSRSGNPTRTTLEQAIAELEGGARGVVTASGMAAIDLVLCLLDAGDRVIAPHDCYGGTHRLLCSREKKGHLKVDFVDFTDDEAYEAALAKGPKLVMIETPSNPLLRVTDVRARAQAAKRAGAVVAADNTFLSPILQQPLSLGCDIVIHSTTKYINGHSDVVGGAVVARDAGLGETLAWWANNTGVTGAPFDSYLTLRGLRTLETRIERQQATAQRVIDLLKDRAEVERVFYPGLEDHPGHEIAAAQQKGFGAMFSVEFASDIEVVQQ